MIKNILITGCSSGIGYDSAHFLKKNYKVYATARNEKDVARLKSEGLNAFVLDVTKEQDITKMLCHILQEDTELYAVFNNAGYGQAGALEDINLKAMREQFETNVFGLHELTRQAIKIMRKQGHGKIIQHSSILGLISLRFRGAYNASKYAIEALCDTLRLELKGSNIFISTINTGPIRSDFRKNAIKSFEKNVNYQESFFKDEYKSELLSVKEKNKDSFTKDSNLVIKNILHILESKTPKPRYYYTFATYLLGTLKRILPTSWLDKLLYKI